MRRKITYFICFLCLLWVGFVTSGQQLQIGNGDREASLHHYRDAIVLYLEALEKSPFNYQLFKKLGECYHMSGNRTEALGYYEKCMITGKFHQEDSIQYARLLLINGKPEKAAATFEELLQRSPDDSELKRMVDCCNFAVSQLSQSNLPLVFNAEQLNSPQSEYGIAFFKDSLIYASTRLNRDFISIDKDLEEGNSDFYITRYDPKSQKFVKPTRIHNNLNSDASESSFTFFPPAGIAFFSRYDNDSAKSRIYQAKLKRKRWVDIKPVNLGMPDFNYMHPSLSVDGKNLFFTSDRPGGFGGKDIWRASVSFSGTVSDPVNLGPAVNTDKDETFPYIAGDSVLFFSSEGHTGMGGLDIFMAGIRENQVDSPVNAGAPINSTGDDFGILLHIQGPGGYFCSNRIQDQQDDIFAFNHKILLPVRKLHRETVALPKEADHSAVKSVNEDAAVRKPDAETTQGNDGLAYNPGAITSTDIIDSGITPVDSISVYYRIQIVASTELADPVKQFSAISDIIDTYGLSVEKVKKTYKYRIGNFTSEKEALAVQQILRKRGYRDCFLVAF